MKRALSRISAIVFIAAVLSVLPMLCRPCTPAYAEESECWAVIIGLSEYESLDNTPGSAEGAEELYQILSPVWGEEHVKLLLDSEATKGKIREALAWLVDNADANDTALLYYSGHGDRGYLSTYTAYYIETWISSTELRYWLLGLDSERFVVILDTCYAGGFNTKLSDSGRVILASSLGSEVSYGTDWGSVFTTYILEALYEFDIADANSDYQLSAEELFQYAEPETVWETEDWSEGAQHPLMSDEYPDELSLLIQFVFRTEPRLPQGIDVIILDEEAYPRYAELIWAPGSVHNLEILPSHDTGKGTRYNFTSWHDGDNSISRVISDGGEYAANFGTQHQLTIQSAYGEPEGGGWYEEGSKATISVRSVEEPTARHIFIRWSGDYKGNEETAQVTMNSPKEVTANWHSEYLLIIQSAYGEPEGEGWYDEGTAATISVQSVMGPTARHYFTGWSGDYTGNEETARIPMKSPKVVKANWHSEYLLTIQSAHGKPEGGGWYDEGTAATISVKSVEGPTARHYFTGWSGDYTGDEEAAQLTMDSPREVKANWHSEYLLTLQSAYAEPEGEGWYDEDTTATISVPESVGVIIRQIFTGWSGDFTGTTPTTTLTVNSPMQVTAEWRTDYLQLYMLIVVLIIVVTIPIVISRRRKRS